MSQLRMRIHVHRALALLVACGVPAVAQSWAILPTNNQVFRGVLVSDSIGALCYDEFQGTTFGLNHLGGNFWVPLIGAGPSSRVGSAVTSGASIFAGVVDAFVVGGADSTGLVNDVLRFVRSSVSRDWTLVPPAQPQPIPSPRFFHACAEFGTGFLMFGGEDLTGVLGDTWEASIGADVTWTGISPSTSPPARKHHTMARGPGGTVVLFGGLSPAGALLGDTWVFSPGNTWTQITGTGPSARSDALMTYDPGRDMVVLHGGLGPANRITDDWEFNGFVWRQVPANSTGLEAIVFDPIIGARGVVGIQSQAGPTDFFRFTASRASFLTDTVGARCDAGNGLLTLSNVDRSLPISGQNLTMRVTGLTPSSVLFGAFELTPLGGPVANPVPNCPVCTLRLTMQSQTATQFVPNVGGVGTWVLPISSSPLLLGRSLELQGIILDSSNPPANPCFAMTTNRCTATVGN